MADSTYYTIFDAAQSLRTFAEQGMSVDQSEANIAKQKADADQSCAHDEDFDKDIKQIKDHLTNALKAMDEHIKNDYLPKSGVVAGLKERKHNFDELSKSIGDVHDAIGKHVKLDQWVSPGAQTYKEALPTQENALQELSGIATSQGKAADQMAQLNQMVFNVTEMSINSIRTKLQQNFPNWNTAATWSAGDRDGGNLNGTWVFDFKYFVRTSTAALWIDQLNDWMTKMKDPTSAEWANAANGIGADLDAVQYKPANLKEFGEWPEAKAKEAAAAAQTTIGDHKADGQEATTDGTGGSANYNRLGVG